MEKVEQIKEVSPGRETLDPQALERLYRLLWRNAREDERNKKHGSGIFNVNSSGLIASSTHDGDTLHEEFDRKERASLRCAGIVGYERRTG